MGDWNDYLKKVASVESIIEQAPRYAHLLDDVAIVGARIAGVDSKKEKGLTPKIKQAALDQALGCLYRAYGPSLQKHAAANFYANLDRAQLAKEALGASFCKLAQASQMDPWAMAARVVHSYDNLVKVASGQSSRAQELASFYLAWCEEMEKRAAILPKLMGFGKKLVGGAKQAVGLSGAPKELSQVAESAMQRSRVPLRVPRGKVPPASKPKSQTGNILKGTAVLGGLGGFGYLMNSDDPQSQYGGSYA
jgi:hypothetical protein